MGAQHTPGPWKVACDSYGKVQHSRKACVYTTQRGPDGERIVTIAARINNWDDARLIAAAPELLSIVRRFVALPAGNWHPERHATEEAELIAEARAAIAKATGAV